MSPDSFSPQDFRPADRVQNVYAAGNVKSFDGFTIELPPGTDFTRFKTVIV